MLVCAFVSSAAVGIANALYTAAALGVAVLARGTISRSFARRESDAVIPRALVIGRAIGVRDASDTATGRRIANLLAEGRALAVEAVRTGCAGTTLAIDAALIGRAVAIEQALYAAARQRIAHEPRGPALLVTRAVDQNGIARATIDRAARSG